jgi:hypothetical protein
MQNRGGRVWGILRLVTLSSTIVLVCGRSYADIVFIDVNNSYAEVETAKKEAAARHEDLLVLPNPDKKIAVQIRDLQQERKKVDKEYSSLNCYGQMLCGGKFTSPQCDGISQKSNDLGDKIQSFTGDKLTVDSMTSAIQDVYKRGHSVSSVIVSGEDGGKIFGAYGTVKFQDLAEVFKNVPQLANDVQSLYLWGCYMATSARLHDNWLQMLPAAKLVVGFHDSGPADGSPPSLALMSKVLKDENAAYLTTAKKFFNKYLEALDMHTSMCVKGEYVDSENDFPLSDIDKVGEACLKSFPDDLQKKYECYEKAEPGCENPPKDHQNSDLRKYYTYLRKNDVCLTNPVFSARHSDTGDPDNVLRLIYYDRVWDNFLRNQGEDMKKLNTLLHATGIDSEFDFKGGPKMTRKEFIDWYEKASEKVEGHEDKKGDFLIDAMAGIHSGIVELDPWYIPDSWITGPSNEKGHFKMAVEADCEN